MYSGIYRLKIQGGNSLKVHFFFPGWVNVPAAYIAGDKRQSWWVKPARVIPNNELVTKV